MRSFTVPALGAGIVIVILAASAVVAAAPTSAGIKACEGPRGALALLSHGQCRAGFEKVTIAKSGPPGPRGIPGKPGPGAVGLRFLGVANSAGTGPTLATIDGVKYTFKCRHMSDGSSQGLLLLTGPAFDVHEIQQSAAGGSSTLNPPLLVSAIGSVSDTIMIAGAASGHSEQDFLTSAVVTVHRDPTAVAHITGYLHVGAGPTAASSTCGLEAQVTPSTR